MVVCTLRWKSAVRRGPVPAVAWPLLQPPHTRPAIPLLLLCPHLTPLQFRPVLKGIKARRTGTEKQQYWMMVNALLSDQNVRLNPVTVARIPTLIHSVARIWPVHMRLHKRTNPNTTHFPAIEPPKCPLEIFVYPNRIFYGREAVVCTTIPALKQSDNCTRTLLKNPSYTHHFPTTFCLPTPTHFLHKHARFFLVRHVLWSIAPPSLRATPTCFRFSPPTSHWSLVPTESYILAQLHQHRVPAGTVLACAKMLLSTPYEKENLRLFRGLERQSVDLGGRHLHTGGIEERRTIGRAFKRLRSGDAKQWCLQWCHHMDTATPSQNTTLHCMTPNRNILPHWVHFPAPKAVATTALIRPVPALHKCSEKVPVTHRSIILQTPPPLLLLHPHNEPVTTMLKRVSMFSMVITPRHSWNLLIVNSHWFFVFL